MDDHLLTQNPLFHEIQDKLMTFSESKDDLTDKIDFVVCLGGDGTLLYASSLFQQSVPPIMAFHLGSLGFLTPFQFQDFEQQVSSIVTKFGELDFYFFWGGNSIFSSSFYDFSGGIHH